MAHAVTAKSKYQPLVNSGAEYESAHSNRPLYHGKQSDDLTKWGKTCLTAHQTKYTSLRLTDNVYEWPADSIGHWLLKWGNTSCIRCTFVRPMQLGYACSARCDITFVVGTNYTNETSERRLDNKTGNEDKSKCCGRLRLLQFIVWFLNSTWLSSPNCMRSKLVRTK